MKPRARSVLALETLEARDVPAVVIVNATTATFIDIDGDEAIVKVSAGALTAGLFTTAAIGLGDQLQRINFTGGGFVGANLAISVKKVPTGDGLVNVGFINSTNHDLGTVTVAGDLGQIDAGDGDPTAPAVKSLTVRSMGRYGTDTQVGTSLRSDLNGALGKLVVKGDIFGASLQVLDGADGTIGSVTIGGSLIGGSNVSSGQILCSGNMGFVKIGHDVQGGTGFISGLITSNGRLAGVTIGGSLIGGSNTDSGNIVSIGDMGPIKIGHDILGGSGTNAGLIQSSGKLAGVTVGGASIGSSGGNSGAIFSSGDIGVVRIGHDMLGGTGTASGVIRGSGKLAGVTIGGSLIGGSGPGSGQITSTGDLGPVKIAHDFQGSGISGTSVGLDGSGAIRSSGRIVSVVIGGSVISGIDTSTGGSLTNNASIRAGNDIGSLTVKGSLIGNTNADGNSPVIISARGREFPVAGSDVAIGKVTIGRRVENALILAGYDVALTPKNADAQIGAVTVGGDWAGSSIAAGVVDGGDGFGNANDVKISGAGTTNTAGIVSKIVSIKIKGLVFGTPGGGADHFGFVAQQIGSLKALGVKAALTAGTDAPLELALTTGDVSVHEVP